MRVKKEYVESRIEMIAKQVEELSELKTDIPNLKIGFCSRWNLMKDKKGNLVQKYVESWAVCGQYSHPQKSIEFPKKILGNQDFVNLTIGHELMHNAQFSSFPNFYHRYLMASSSEQSLTMKKLFEGDARLMENKLEEIYYLHPEFKSPFFLNWFCRDEVDSIKDIYYKPCRILENDFNGDRKKINELYSLPVEELSYIFNR